MAQQLKQIIPYCLRIFLSIFIAYSYFYSDDRFVITIISVFILLAGSFITYIYASKSPTIQRKNISKSRILSFVIAFLSVLTFLPQETINSGTYGFTDILASLVIFIYCYLLASNLFRYFLDSNQQKKSKLTQSWFWPLFFLFFLVSMIYLWAFFPGIFVIDSVNQWDQIHSNIPWNDWHPVAHTFVIKLLTLVGDKPVTFVFFQVVCYSLVLAYTTDFIRSYARRGIFIFTIAFLLLFPLLPLSSIQIIKDSAFTISLLLMTTCLMKMIVSNGDWLKPLHNLFILAISFLGVIFFRHNGWPVFIVFLLISLLFLRKNYLKYYLTAIVCTCAYLFITGPIYNHFEVIRTDSTESLGIFVQVAGEIITADGDMDKEEEEYLYSLMSKEDWIELYRPRDVDNIKFKARFKKDIIKEDPKKFLVTTLSIAKKNPLLAAKAYIQQTEMLWHTNMTTNNLRPMFRTQLKGKVGPYYFLNKQQMEKYQPDYKGLKLSDSRFKNQALEIFLEKSFNKLYRSQLRLFIMPALYLILFLLSIGILYTKGYGILSLAFLPYFLSLGTMFVAIPAPDPRYALPNYFISLITLCLASGLKDKKFLEVRHAKNKETR